jgi:hypothetical protein
LTRLLIYLALWTFAGVASTALANQFLDLPLTAIQGGLIGLIIGAVALLPTLSTARGRHLFYEGPDPHEEGDPLIGCLWLFAIECLLFALFGWLIWLVIQLMGIFRR